MMTTDCAFAAFAHPALDPAGRRLLREQLIVDAAKHDAAMFVRRCASGLAQASSGLAEVLADWCQSDITFAEALQVPLGLRTIRATALDPLWVAAQMAAHLHAQGRGGRWQLSFAAAAPLAFGWRFIPACREMTVDASGGDVQLSVDQTSGDTETLGHEAIVVDFGGSDVRIVDRDIQRQYPFQSLVELADVPTADIADTLRETACLLRRHAPHYLHWVQGALAALVPLRRPENAYQSFSLMGVNATVFACFPVPPLKLAELLVHEVSHQYYHFAQFRTSFSNGTDQALYYSPFVQKKRPIERILIGFHAFANIALFYRSSLAGGLRDDRALAEKELESNLRHLGPMAKDLEATSDLTPTARGLFEPLRQELFA